MVSLQSALGRWGILLGAVTLGLIVACGDPFGRSYETNGERIFFTGRNEAGDRIGYDGGPSTGPMGGGALTCAACHGSDAEGGTRTVRMARIDAPDIRWSALAGEATVGDEHGSGAYDLDTFRDAVVRGEHPDGSPLSTDMPRWRLSDADLQDVADYLATLP